MQYNNNHITNHNEKHSRQKALSNKIAESREHLLLSHQDRHPRDRLAEDDDERGD